MASPRAVGVVTPERWQQIKAIVSSAMDLSGMERDSYVASACAEDAELRREVESLLGAADGTDSLPVARVAIAAAAEQSILESALGQQYEIIRAIGRGGMGAVYLARERALERFVAIKVLRPELADAQDSRERFRREARIAAQLSHPGILPLHTFGEVGGLWYFVMAYVRGVSLAERLRVEGRLPSAEAHRILTELADALECAHRNGVIHRDIKPANILLDAESGRVMLADFGISKVQGAGDSLTATGAVVGTPHYMSPEQALGSADVDERSDIYSLGAVGYMMLAGKEPFADVSADKLMYWRVTHDPPPLQALAPTAPAPLAAVVMRSLMREPGSRWANVRSFKDALARAGESAVQLPESVRDLPTFGPYAVLWAIAWTLIAFRKFSSPGDRAMLLLIALVVPVGFALHIWNVGRRGPGVVELARVAFWPPEWWGMWWPRFLRRPTDLWSRLPFPARLVRAVLSFFIVALPAMILLRQRFANDGVAGEQPTWFVATEAILVAGVAIVLLGSLVWASRRALAWGDSVRVLFGATTTSPGWSEPHIARLLAPAQGGVRPPERDSPTDHRRAIEELMRTLAPPTASMGAAAALAARQLLTAIEVCDAEISSLTHVASANELDRLTAQLATLGDVAHERSDKNVAPSNARNLLSDQSERGELHDLVRRQLDVVRRMRDQSEMISQRRATLFTLLRGLWTQLSLLRDATSGDASVPNGASDRMKSLLAEIAAELFS